VAKKRSESAERRKAERAAAKLVRAKERLAELEPGGSPARAIAVESASVVEAHARSLHCHQCGGAVRVDEHLAIDRGGERLREARVVCATCGARRSLYFMIARLN
jgi:hypothetical protein